MYSSILIWVIVLVGLSWSPSECEACTQKFKRAKDLEKISKECLLKSEFSTVPTTADLQKPDFDDKCYVKCIMGKLDLIDEDGHIDKDAFSDFLQENVSDQTLVKLNEMSNACMDSSGVDKVKGSKKGSSSDECKAMQKFYSCFITASDKFC